ncbi:hypothetical protein ACOMHN_047843 [Nucella lapillus]
MAARNSGIEFDEALIKNVNINLPAIKLRAEILAASRGVKKQWQAAWQLRAVTCIDLTTLAGDDTPVNISRLCYKAAHPIRADLLKDMGIEPGEVTTGAVCVYPRRVVDCKRAMDTMKSSIPIASVATGFPTGQTGLKTRLDEIHQAVLDGASEIDIVINRPMALHGDWKGVYDEVRLMREACGEAHLKAILAIGELGTMVNVYKAAMVCMMAGADFVKTSTGKEAVNATIPVSLVMVRAVRDYYQRTLFKVGFKPAGGIRTAKEACLYLTLMHEELGEEWTRPQLFRIGASSLLTDLERQIYFYVKGSYPAACEFPLP